MNSTTFEWNDNFKTNKKSISKFNIKQQPESVIYEQQKPPKGRVSSKRGISSLRNKTSQTAKKASGEKKSNKVLENPEITKLAPFSASLVTGKRLKYSHLSTPNWRGGKEGANCLKSIAERKTILREIQNLSQALISQQTKFELAMDRVKEEHKKYKKQKKLMKNSEMKKKDHIDYLKRRIDDLKRNEENLLDDLVQQQAISKEALHCLDNLKIKFDDEK